MNKCTVHVGRLQLRASKEQSNLIVSFQTLKRHYLVNYCREGTTPPAYSLLAFGTFSSCCGQVAAYPLALVRTKLQSQGNLVEVCLSSCLESCIRVDNGIEFNLDGQIGQLRHLMY